MNNEFFKPRGLYCLIMTYRPESNATHALIDLTQMITTSMKPASSSKQTFKNLRLSSGKTYGEVQLPEAAPLIFPALDSLDEKETQSKMKAGQKFVADYLDRRAQAKFNGETPGSKLSTQISGGEDSTFKSRYADPNHPANSGSLIGLLTGGHVNPKGRRTRRMGDRREMRSGRRGQEITPETRKRKEGIVRRTLKKDVLYLMIVNLPSEEEMRLARDAVDAEEREKEEL